MVTDPGTGRRVARLIAMICASAAMAGMAGAGCGPVVRPNDQIFDPSVARPQRPHPASSGTQVLIGELCPQGAGGRPAIAPIAMHEVAWMDAAQDLANAIERGAVPRFGVFGVDGKLAGTFETLGLADIAPGLSVASGTYVGGPPCTAEGGKGNRTPLAACGPIATGCGLAVGVLGRPDDPPTTPVLVTGGACIQGDALAVDIDGDHTMELFPLSALLDGQRGPAEEWTASPVIGAGCEPSFAVYGTRLTPGDDPAATADPKRVVGMDVMGVVDVDGDGRKEIILALQFPTVRTIVVYTSTGSPQRLELAGEGQAFPR